MKHSQQKYQILLSNLYSRVPPKIPYITYNRDCESSSLAEEYFTVQWHTWEVKQTSRSSSVHETIHNSCLRFIWHENISTITSTSVAQTCSSICYDYISRAIVPPFPIVSSIHRVHRRSNNIHRFEKVGSLHCHPRLFKRHLVSCPSPVVFWSSESD